jgi:hypothetical protein
MTRIRIGSLALALALGWPVSASEFSEWFTGGTLRFDYYHSGTAGEEHVSLDAVRLEGEWPGRRTHLLDDTNLGKYRFAVVGLPSNRVLFSQGFASIYGEWETTGEARDGIWRTFHESQRFPEPRSTVQLVLSKRGADGAFREIFSTVVDPGSRFVDRSPIAGPAPPGEVWSVFEHGSPAEHVDLLFLGDGYTAAELDQFHADVERLTEVLFSTPTFHRHRSSFNVRAIDLVSRDSGITDPRAGRFVASPLGLSYNAFDSERYVLTMRNRELREIAAAAPYDALVLLANSRKYGGGGIFGLWTTVAARSAESAYVVVHELGHSFAGLADEYYTSQVAYQDFTPPGVEPWEPNVTTLLAGAELEWAELVAPGTPIPTPWSQEAYDAVSLRFQERRRELRAARAPEEALESLFQEEREVTGELLGNEPHAGVVGAFEGAAYEAKGLYRPALDCIMFTRNPRSFCPVCSLAIERVIRLHTGGGP